MPELPLRSTVAPFEDIPEKSLRRGQVGTIVEVLGPFVYEIEFSNDSGRRYASLARRGDRLLLLYT